MRCTLVIIGKLSLISSVSVLACSKFLTTPFELFSDLCAVTATRARLPNKTPLSKLFNWDFYYRLDKCHNKTDV